MRIAIFTVRMLLGNGVDLVIHELAKRLVEQYGHTVDVWTPTSDGTYDNEPYGLHKLLVYGGKFNKALPLLEINAFNAMKRLAAEFAAANHPYDVVVPCAHPYYGAGRAFNAPSVFFNFGNVPTTGFTWKGKLNWAWLDFSEDWFHKPYSERVVSISHFLHGKQSHDVQRKGEVLHLAGDHYSTGDALAQRKALRESLGIAEDDVVLGYCGRLFRSHPPYKGTHKVLELGQRVKSFYPKSHLLMCGIGDPSDGDWIRGEGAIALLNHPPKDMPAFFDALDIYVCASRWEGFNLPIVEAAWHHVPSVAYDAGAHSEHVTSVLVPDGQFDELCSATLTLVRNKAQRDLLCKAAYERAQEFSWDKVAMRFEASLGELTR